MTDADIDVLDSDPAGRGDGGGGDRDVDVAPGRATPAGPSGADSTGRGRGSVLEVFLVALRLGLTSFGGPIAHLGYFEREYVQRRRWLDESTYADLVAVGQFLPGPASSQVGMSIGMLRAGLAGGVASWLGFTLPSAIMLTLFGFGADYVGSEADGWLHGLKVVAVAVVALAVWGMAKSLAFDRSRGTIAISAAIVMLVSGHTAAQIVVIVVGGIVGRLAFGGDATVPKLDIGVRFGRRTALVAGLLFATLLVALPIARQNVDNQALNMSDSFYRSGSLVFGGGHVVLPLLESEVVEPGWISDQDFLAGYGAAQAVPGPLFAFSSYLGATMEPAPNGLPGAGLALIAIYLPAFLLIVGVLPLWGTWRQRSGVQAALRGVNAAVVGILLAALYDPVFTSAVADAEDFGLALAAFGALAVWKLPPWLVVGLTAAVGGLMGAA